MLSHMLELDHINPFILEAKRIYDTAKKEGDSL